MAAGTAGGRRVVVVSTYPPRRCGLATFTYDLRAALAEVVPRMRVDVAAVDYGRLPYGPEVMARIEQHDPQAYPRVGRQIAGTGVDLVVIQHEYGIFGGPEGAYILELAKVLRQHRVPYLVTLHTVLSAPAPGQAAVLRDLCRNAAGITVFTPGARRLLTSSGLVESGLVSVVPHGAPAILRNPHRIPAYTPPLRAALPPAVGTPVLTTFGLLGPGKGIEQAIAALPGIAARHPLVRYVIAGATHPDVLRQHGEEYRNRLVRLAERMGVAERVRFVDAFLTEPELAALLARTTIYLTPYRGVDQACSGTLAFALAAGCPTVSTPYRYAVEMLTPPGVPPAGVLVPPGEPGALTGAVNDLLDEPARLARMRGAAHALGQHLDWPHVAARFAAAYAAAGASAAGTTGSAAAGVRASAAPPPVPVRGALRAVPVPVPTEVATDDSDLEHLDRLVDATGIIQFARHTRPDRASGYCVDDAARLAIVAAQRYRGGDPRPRRWLRAALYLMNTATVPGGMHNVLGPDRQWQDTPYLGDHVGRAIWAAGVVSGTPDLVSQRHRPIARHLLHTLAPLVPELRSLRSVAYAILGLSRVAGTIAMYRAGLRGAAPRLSAAVRQDADWYWFEPRLTYDNARLPQALLAAGACLGDAALTAQGLSTLDWYLGQVGLAAPVPMLRCVGNRGRHRDALDATEEGDEQPLDAAATVAALVAAWQVTGQNRYATLAQIAFAWFHGYNRAGLAVHDAATGGCHDGLSAHGVNANEGAESTLAYHQALGALQLAGIPPVGPVAPVLVPHRSLAGLRVPA